MVIRMKSYLSNLVIHPEIQIHHVISVTVQICVHVYKWDDLKISTRYLLPITTNIVILFAVIVYTISKAIYCIASYFSSEVYAHLLHVSEYSGI